MRTSFSLRTIQLYGREFFYQDVLQSGWCLYIAQKAMEGDRTAIEMAHAMALMIRDANKESWFDYRDYPLTDDQRSSIQSISGPDL